MKARRMSRTAVLALTEVAELTVILGATLGAHAISGPEAAAVIFGGGSALVVTLRRTTRED